MTDDDGGPYSRLYWRFRDEFPDIYADKALLGWWASLLISAEGSFPAAAELPRKIDDETVQKLVDASLITLLGADRYRCRGLDAERARRGEAARFAADVRHHGIADAMRRQSERNARAMRPHSDSNADHMPRRDETRRDETPRRNASGANGMKSIDELLPGVLESVTAKR